MTNKQYSQVHFEHTEFMGSLNHECTEGRQVLFVCVTYNTNVSNLDSYAGSMHFGTICLKNLELGLGYTPTDSFSVQPHGY